MTIGKRKRWSESEVNDFVRANNLQDDLSSSEVVPPRRDPTLYEYAARPRLSQDTAATLCELKAKYGDGSVGDRLLGSVRFLLRQSVRELVNDQLSLPPAVDTTCREGRGGGLEVLAELAIGDDKEAVVCHTLSAKEREAAFVAALQRTRRLMWLTAPESPLFDDDFTKELRRAVEFEVLAAKAELSQEIKVALRAAARRLSARQDISGFQGWVRAIGEIADKDGVSLTAVTNDDFEGYYGASLSPEEALSRIVKDKKDAPPGHMRGPARTLN